MKKIFNDNEKRISFILFVITMLVAILPLFSRYCINGHDLEYHLLRIESLKEGILIGKPFLKVNTLFFGGAGYASSMFYSDLFMYIPAILRVIGFSIGASYHIFVAVIFILCYLSTYFCTYKITNNRYVASLGAILLTLSPYHMDDMLVRAACGEYMAFVFIPFVVYGIYNVLFEDMSHPYAFAVGFGGLILSHPATLLLNVLFAIGMFVIFIKTFIKKPFLIFKLFITSLITVFVTAFYWMPMLEQMMSTSFYVSTNEFDMLDAALDMVKVFANDFPGAGPLLLVLLIPRVFVSRKDNPLIKFADALSLAGILFGICSSNIIPWEHIERFVSFIQFPWRLLTMTTALLSIADAIILMSFVSKYNEKLTEIALYAVVAICCFMAITHSSENATGYYDYGDDYYSYLPFTANVIGGEWLPGAVADREVLVELSQHMIADNGSELEFTRHRAEIDADIPSGIKEINVPFIYYKGYKATLVTEDGQLLSLAVSNEGINGMCLVKTDGQAGHLRVWYKGTKIVWASCFISIGMVAWLVICFIGEKREWRLKKIKE